MMLEPEKNKFYIFFMSEGCEPCHEELREMDEHDKVNQIDLDKDRFLIINVMDKGHRVWTELLKPMGTPTMYCVESVSLNKLSQHSGEDCVDKVFKETGIECPWEEQEELCQSQ
jgi:hypothetical protein